MAGQQLLLLQASPFSEAQPASLGQRVSFHSIFKDFDPNNNCITFLTSTFLFFNLQVCCFIFSGTYPRCLISLKSSLYIYISVGCYDKERALTFLFGKIKEKAKTCDKKTSRKSKIIRFEVFMKFGGIMPYFSCLCLELCL